ncbi:MAG: ABC transporter permease [Oligoflexia bacterium]|nr:ABC transporter permease [Oligoflexia bacterium]
MWQNIKELYRYRSLIAALVQRHLSMRYRGSLLGFLWTLLNPLCLMLVYTVVFRYYIRFNQVENYTIFLFCGLLPWLWITSALTEGVGSVVASGHLITKSMFPAQVLPAVAVLTTLINFLLSLPILFLFMLATGMPFKLTLLALPGLIALQFVFLFGMVLALSSLNVHYRDIQHLVSNILTFLFFLCPIVYPASSVPERFRFSLTLNPFALITQSYHMLILEGVLPPLSSAIYLSAWAVLCVVLGGMIYTHYRESFAELL